MKITVTNRDAKLSDCGGYRYWLGRTWDAEGYPNLERALIPLWVCLNPSTADATVDDATVRSIMRISTAWGYGAMILCNVFAWRATDPRELRVAGEFAQGPDNNTWLKWARARADVVIAAWGESEFVTVRDERRVYDLVGDYGMACPGRNKSGSPRHPLYLPTNTSMNYWQPYR